MLPSSPLLAAVLLFPVLVFVMAIGLVTGWLSATALRTNYKGLLLDAMLAPVAAAVVFAVAVKIPWHGSYVEDGWTFNNQFPHPRAWSLGAAFLWPVAHEVFRFGRRKPD
jgi:hypothetical protein